MSGQLTSILDLLGALVDLFKKIKNESIIALVGLAILVVFATVILPAGISLERFVTAIVALVLIFIIGLIVLLRLGHDRRVHEQEMDAQEKKTERIREQLEQTIAKERERNERFVGKCARETASATTGFAVQLLEDDKPPEKIRSHVLMRLADWLDYLAEKNTEYHEDEISAWFQAIARDIKKERDYTTFKELKG